MPTWRLSDLSETAIQRASQLREVMLPTLTHIGTATAREEAAVAHYRRVFGHSISRRHWRRLFRRTINRDGGAENWARLEIYLDENPARRPEFRKRPLCTPVSLQPLQELIASFENPAAPTQLEKDYLWIYSFEHFEREVERSGKPKAVKHSLIKFLWGNASFLGRSVKGVGLQFNRKRERWIAGSRIPAAIADG